MDASSASDWGEWSLRLITFQLHVLISGMDKRIWLDHQLPFVQIIVIIFDQCQVVETLLDCLFGRDGFLIQLLLGSRGLTFASGHTHEGIGASHHLPFLDRIFIIIHLDFLLFNGQLLPLPNGLFRRNSGEVDFLLLTYLNDNFHIL